MRVTTRVNKLNEILMEGYLSFKYFAENIVKEVEGYKVEIADFHQEWIDAILKNDNVVISASRGSGKSLVMGVLFPLYIATYNSNKSILIVSPTEERSFEILQKIRYVIENNSLLKFLKPESGTGTWSKHKLDTSNHCQFYCKVLSSNIRGHHVDYLLLDECGEIGDGEIFFSAVLPTIYTKNGKCVAIGTPTSNSDLLNTLSRRKTFKSLRYPAIKLINGKLIPLWEKKFSISKLNRIKRTMGASRFEREFMLNIVSKENQPFTPEMLMSCQNDKLRYLENGDINREYFIGVDLAYSKKGDYTVITVFEMQPNEVMRLVYMFRVRGMDIPSQENKLIEIMNKFPPKRVVIDISLFGLNMVNNLSRMGYPIEGFSFGGRGKRSLILFTALKAYSDKKIEIPYHESVRDGICGVKNLEREASNMQLIDGSFKSVMGHDDILISVGLGLYAASKFKSCLVYGASNSSNIYKEVNRNYGGRNYKEQKEKYIEYLQSLHR